MKRYSVLWYIGSLWLLFPSSVQGQLKYSASLYYVYSLKWHRDSYYTYYFDVKRNHTLAIQGDIMIPILKKWIKSEENVQGLSVGIASELIYLPYSALHYVSNEYIGNINGLDQWKHQYHNDIFHFVYLTAGFKARYEFKNLGFISFMKAYPITLNSSDQTRSLFINNKTGEYNFDNWVKGSSSRDRSPQVMTELMVGIKMFKSQYFMMGFEWYERSSVDLNMGQYFIDNREFAFRNVKIGWNLVL